MGYFSIEMGHFRENHPSRHRPPNDNRAELEAKWAHFEILRCRATTYVKTKEICDLTLDPPYTLKGVQNLKMRESRIDSTSIIILHIFERCYQTKHILYDAL